jgi:hypothetical protein
VAFHVSDGTGFKKIDRISCICGLMKPKQFHVAALTGQYSTYSYIQWCVVHVDENDRRRGCVCPAEQGLHRLFRVQPLFTHRRIREESLLGLSCRPHQLDVTSSRGRVLTYDLVRDELLEVPFRASLDAVAG